MNSIVLLLLAFIIVYCFSNFSFKKESFTDAENSLTLKLLNFLKSPPTNYFGYATILNKNGNTSTNLHKIDTYKKLVAKGTNILQNDIINEL